MTAPAVQVERASADQRPAIAQMMQLYIHDFSEHWAGTERGELQADGRFAPYPLDAYWTEPERIPLLIHADGHLAGFALINRHAHSGLAADRCVAEFFVVRKHRRAGVGQLAAREIFSRWPGLWEAAVARRNTGALGFWRQAVAGHPGVSDIEEIDARSEDWDGPILRFRIA